MGFRTPSPPYDSNLFTLSKAVIFWFITVDVFDKDGHGRLVKSGTVGVLVSDPYSGTAVKSRAMWGDTFGFQCADTSPFHDMFLDVIRVNDYHSPLCSMSVAASIEWRALLM